MSAHVVVIDSSFRTVKIKVTPATKLNDVLREACKKWNYVPSNYELKYSKQSKVVDLTHTFRQTGLSSGGKLELIVASKTPGVISVALQIPDPSGPGRRLVDKFPSNTTFWQVLRKFESSDSTNLNFTARGVAEVANGSSGAGRIFYEMPHLNSMGEDLVTVEDLQQTLADFGPRSGSCMIKLSFKKTNQPLEEAMAEIGQFFKTKEELEAAPAPGREDSEAVPPALEGITEAIARINSAEPSGEDTKMKDATAAVSGDPLVTPTKRPAPEEVVLGPNQRPVSVYAAPSSDVPQAALQTHNEDDYEPTIAHAKLHQSRLLNRGQNQRLLGDAELEQLEKEKSEKLATIKTMEIKFRFPDQTTMVVSFTADDDAAYLYNYVKQSIAAEDQPFKLVWNDKGPQTIPKDDKNSKKKLIKDLGLKGRVLVNLVWEDSASDSARNAPTLKAGLLREAKPVAVPDVTEVEAKAEDVTPSTDKGKGKENSEGGSSGKGKGVPKWLKGLTKK